uniref:(northern house mosquito) hypothetical protein n=1 Tax=Culex pipiens TaxID=7175 RepID=A0A8D8NAU6_CULPI
MALTCWLAAIACIGMAPGRSAEVYTIPSGRWLVGGGGCCGGWPWRTYCSGIFSIVMAFSWGGGPGFCGACCGIPCWSSVMWYTLPGGGPPGPALISSGAFWVPPPCGGSSTWYDCRMGIAMFACGYGG